MTDSRLPELAEKIATGVRTIIGEIRPKLIEAALSGRQGERKNVRHADNFLSQYDIWMHQRYRELLQDILPSFLYTSEEGDPERVGEDIDPDLCVLVDPLDTSELAVRGLHGYTHILIYSRRLSRPVVAVVGDIFHQIQLYIGARNEHGHDEAFVITADGNLRPIKVTDSPELKDALVTNYLMRPAERFAPLARQQGFLAALGAPAEDGRQRGRIGVGYGSVSLCHVATGQTDAMVEFAKGFATWDLYPGHYILEAAGGVVLDLQGDPIPLEGRLGSKERIAKAMNERQEFVATATVELANEIISTLDLKRG